MTDEPPVPLFSERVVKPRRRGYIARPIIALVGLVGVTDEGELVEDLPAFIERTHNEHGGNTPYVFITWDPALLLESLVDHFGDRIEYTTSATRDDKQGPTMSKGRLRKFRLRMEGRRATMHVVWDPASMFSTPSVGANLIPNNHASLLRFAVDVRDWCERENLPLKDSVSGHGASLLRDGRFWPDDRRKVPTATNEKVRTYLPGIYRVMNTPPYELHPSLIELDQTRAYHNVAQTLPLPDPDTTFAKGYYDDERLFSRSEGGHNLPGLWATVGTELFQRIASQPGLLAVIATSGTCRRGYFRPPVCEGRARSVRFVWSNELSHCICQGLRVEGIVAAWTSEAGDAGFPRYGRYAANQIAAADKNRQTWLKIALHSTYGILGARRKILVTGHSHGRSGRDGFYAARGRMFPVKEHEHKLDLPTTNVLALGMLEAEVRLRSIELANRLTSLGGRVACIYSDAVFVDMAQLPLDLEGWKAAPVTNWQAVDDVSFTSDQRTVLPGRDAQTRAKEVRRIAQRTIHAARSCKIPESRRQDLPMVRSEDDS